MQELLDPMIRTYQVAKQFDRVFGHTLATSGYIRASAGCLLDWGLVVVRPSRVGQNAVPDFPPQPEFTLMKPGDAIYVSEVMKLGDELMLFGHASGVRTGTVSAIISNIKWLEQPALTKEYAICGEVGESFSKAGDSGASNKAGRLAGMLVAGAKAITGVSYVTPIQAVIDDIRAQTGYDVCLP